MRTRARLYGGRRLYDRVVVASNIPEMIVMIRHILVIDLRAVLRTMLIAGALDDAAGAEWDMYPGEGTSSQDAIDGAGAIEL